MMKGISTIYSDPITQRDGMTAIKSLVKVKPWVLSGRKLIIWGISWLALAMLRSEQQDQTNSIVWMLEPEMIITQEENQSKMLHSDVVVVQII